MSPQSGGNGGELRGAGSSAAKGALLIAIAIVIGIFLLQQVDSDADTASSGTTNTKPKTTTTTTTAGASSTTTTVPALPAKEPNELAVIVLNGGAPSGTAAGLQTELAQAGYTNQNDANNWEGHSQAGITILCKPGREREAVALSQQTALEGAQVQPFPDPAPPFSEDRDCVVVVGSS
jgi:hypothetical protein